MKTAEEIKDLRKQNEENRLVTFEKENQILLNEIESELIKDGIYIFDKNKQDSLFRIRKYSDKQKSVFVNDLIDYLKLKSFELVDISKNNLELKLRISL